MASDPSSTPMYVTKAGAKVAKKGSRVEVRFRDEVLSSTRLIDVSQVCVFGNVQVTTQLVRTLMGRDVPIFWFSTGAWLSGITEGLPSKHVELRRRQYRLGDSSEAVAVAGAMIEGKIRNSRTLLRRNSSSRDDQVLRSLKRLANKAANTGSVSYTHLALAGSLGRRPSPAPPRFEFRRRSACSRSRTLPFRPGPVSYTHLDVYKRQSQERAAWSGTSTPSIPTGGRKPSRAVSSDSIA